MRVCAKHFKLASEVLKSLKTGEEFDLCPECESELREIMNGRAEPEPEIQPTARNERVNGLGRAPGRPKKKVA